MSRALALVDSSDDSRKFENPDSASISGLLLETKFHVPRGRSRLVPRPRLTALVHQHDAKKLTLVTAPAGFGKTTLLGGWLAETGIATNAGWVSLDSGDNEPRLFCAYVVRALQKAHPGVGMQAAAMLQSVPAPSIERIVTTLINEIAAIDAEIALVLDDYHVIDEPQVHQALTFLLDHLPPRMRVVIASRSEPPVGVARLRARGELTELHATDLRFTRDEASVFLNQVMALDVSPTDVERLAQHTEGWIAGLQLAALSIKGGGDSHRFVEEFSGENRHIADYLVDEVLRAEPEDVQRFLLATSILARMNGPLCDAVTGETGTQSLLDDLERRNLFVVALDDRRGWYRYHHLFAEVLQRHAVARNPGASRFSHARASAWCAEHGDYAEAVRHSLAAGDFDQAASLLEQRWPEKDRSYESAKWLARVKSLPDAVVRTRPVLAMGYAWALLNSGELESAEQWLRYLDQTLQGDPANLVVNDRARLDSLPMELESARIYLTQSLGQIPGTLENAMRMLEQIPASDRAGRATAIALVALALWGRGELERAHDTFADALDVMRAADHGLDVIRGMFVLGDIRAAQGRLREAAIAYRRGLDLANESAEFSGAETDELHLGMSELDREWNELASAAEHLEAIRERESAAGHKGNRQRWCIAMARLGEARGDPDGALRLLSEGEKHERRDPVPRARPLSAVRARIHVAQGKLDEAASWASAASVTVRDELSYLREFEHITLARLLIAQRRTLATDVLPFLDRLRIAAQTGRRAGSVIEVLMLESLAQHALGSMRGALDPLAQALTLAEPEGFLRVFLDEGPAMRDLLRTATARGLAGSYTRRVLAAFDAPVQPTVPRMVTATPTNGAQMLTTRELEILRLIAAGLRNQEIAEHLEISAATVKRHIANAYGKLGAGHRTEALARATALKLL